MKDIADGYLEEEGKPVLPTDNYTLVGYCTADNLPGFVLDPPRGKAIRVALVFFFFSKAHDTEGLQIHKLEVLEPDQVKDAALRMQKLRTLTMHVRAGLQTAEKRSHDFALGSSG